MANAVPIYKIDSEVVENAWQAFRALQLAVADKPELARNPYFSALMDTAYSRFLLAFEAL